METGHKPETTICRLGDRSKLTEPCSIVIFGASGDLTARKLVPAFYHLARERQMPPDYRIVGFARREKTDESWRHAKPGFAYLRRGCAPRRNSAQTRRAWAKHGSRLDGCQPTDSGKGLTPDRPPRERCLVQYTAAALRAFPRNRRRVDCRMCVPRGPMPEPPGLSECRVCACALLQ